MNGARVDRALLKSGNRLSIRKVEFVVSRMRQTPLTPAGEQAISSEPIRRANSGWSLGNLSLAETVEKAL